MLLLVNGINAFATTDSPQDSVFILQPTQGCDSTEIGSVTELDCQTIDTHHPEWQVLLPGSAVYLDTGDPVLRDALFTDHGINVTVVDDESDRFTFSTLSVINSVDNNNTIVQCIAVDNESLTSRTRSEKVRLEFWEEGKAEPCPTTLPTTLLTTIPTTDPTSTNDINTSLITDGTTSSNAATEHTASLFGILFGLTAILELGL